LAKYASIDIGTNTLRLLVAGLGPEGTLKPLQYERAITRLGGSYTLEAGIDAGAAERTIEALKRFSERIKEAGVQSVRAVATSVVRRAANRAWFLDKVKERTGLDVEVITGDEEARLSLLGVKSVLDCQAEKLLVFDIGGGSTEFIAARAEETREKGGAGIAGLWSMEMGVVHLTEKYLSSDPPAKAETNGLFAEVDRVVAGLKDLMAGNGVDPEEFSAKSGALLVGTAGTITTLAAIDLGLERYDRDRINNHTMTKERVEEIYHLRLKREKRY
jgi:exopolyphosphatase/guanosine-5'-triphosphate,3'-diphosphate pyrophosphatase